MKEKLEGDALFYSFLFQVIRFVSIVVVIVIYMSYVFAKEETPPPPPPHICEVTSADLRGIIRIVDGKMKEFDKKLAYRDMQIAGLQERASKKEGL